jgi:cytochrome c-type biogenesis protein CcmH/NrfF
MSNLLWAFPVAIVLLLGFAIRNVIVNTKYPRSRS